LFIFFLIVSAAKNCQSNAQQSQSCISRRRRQQSCNNCNCNCNCNCNNSSSSINSYFLIMALAALLPLLPLTNARHLHDQLALSYDEDLSSDSSLPAWQPNPFHGLDQGSYDSDASSFIISSSSGDVSSDNESRDYVESGSSYEEITQAAIQAAMREIRRQRIRHRRSHNLHYFIRSQHEALSAPNEWENPCGGDFRPNKNQASEAENSSRGNVIKRKVRQVPRH